MPRPRPGEKREDFLERCMGSAEARNDYPNERQRFAVCQSFWENRNTKKAAPDLSNLFGQKDEKGG